MRQRLRSGIGSDVPPTTGDIGQNRFRLPGAEVPVMGFYRSFAGSVLVRVIAADLPQFLRQLEEERIGAKAVCSVDVVTLELIVARGDLPKLQKLCTRRGYELQ